MTDREILELLLQKMTGMEERITGIEGKVGGIEGELQKIKENMATKEELAEVKSFVSDIPAMKVAVLETAGVVKRIEDTQEHHERTLDLLSRRSIDQEAELKRIK